MQMQEGAAPRGKVLFSRDLTTGKQDVRFGGSLADTTVNTGVRIGGSSPDEAKIEAAYIGFGTRLQNRWATGSPIHTRIATVATTPNLLNRELWLNALPNMRMWEGAKVIDQISAESLPIVTRPHEATISIGKGTIQNDQLGLYGPHIDKLGDAFPNALDDLAVTFLCAGIQGTSLGSTYDGQNLIDTDHTFRSADAGVAAFQRSNKIAGAFSAAVFQAAMQRYYKLTNEKGIPVNMGNRRMLLVHGPDNEILVRNVLRQQIAAGLSQNLDVGRAEPVMVPWIQARTTSVLGTSVTLTGLEWFLIPEGSASVIIQVKRAAEFLSVEEGYQVFMNARFYYGIEAEFGGVYGLWQEVVGGPGS
jgi:phage major head subunit gpT-like protein